ncbi:unnamed protein product [Orchesella dallaii]|uniref:Protein unc-13 D n=1 Tax=Orchesella dallaii TaxID=48710 RepID=A0ABP1PV01_9HEXA
MPELQCMLDLAYKSFLNRVVNLLGDFDVDNLYTESLFKLLHHNRFRPENEKQSVCNDLIGHLQKVFIVDNAKHAQLLNNARNKVGGSLVLKLEVVEAKGLKGKDINGLSDPACTIFVSPYLKENTSIKLETLNPVWKENFSFPVVNVQEDSISIEVWDYDEEERVTDKIRRISEVKSSKSFKIFVKDIVSIGKQRRDVLGCLKIPLMDIPPEGIDAWYYLENRNGIIDGRNGEIHVKIGLGVEKQKKLIFEEYHKLLHFMLGYELFCEQNAEPYKWHGEFKNKLSILMLRTLELQGGLTRKDVDVAQWLAYTDVHCRLHAFDSKMFISLFQKLLEHIESQAIEDFDELCNVWQSTEKLFDNFVAVIENIHQHQQHFSSNEEVTSCLQHILEFVSLVQTYFIVNPTLGNKIESKLSSDYIRDKMRTTIHVCANEFCKNTILLDTKWKSTEQQVEEMIKSGKLLMSNLEGILNMYQNEFKKILDIDYFEITYLVYDKTFCEVVSPIVADVCTSLKPRHLINELNYDSCRYENFEVGTALFKLYLVLKQFADMSIKIQSANSSFRIHGNYHTWFHNTIVVQWLYIARFKAMNCISAAVTQDSFKPLDDFNNVTSSAIDTAGILHRVEIWNQLSWPDEEGASSFITKILHDLDKCAMFYAELMREKVKQIESTENEQNRITDEVCFAINNIERISNDIRLIGEQIEVKNSVRKFSSNDRPLVEVQCNLKSEAATEKTTENMNNKIQCILEDITLKIHPYIQNLIAEAADSDHDGISLEKMKKYLSANLRKLNKKLSQSTFEDVFQKIWRNVVMNLQLIIMENIQKQREPDFFQGINKILDSLLHFFYPEDFTHLRVVSHSENINEIQQLLKVHSASTSQLILDYCQERLHIQSKIGNKTAPDSPPSPFGYLAVRAHYCEDIETLKIELLNARNLKPRDQARRGSTNVQRDSYVKITLIMDNSSQSIPVFKSKTKKRTLFPWFDEEFSIPLKVRPNDGSTQGFIMFTLKDFGLLGKSGYVGDCLLPLKSVPITTSDSEFKDFPQIILPLTLPTEKNESSLLGVLENRQWDKTAVEFLKRERTKMALSSCCSSTTNLTK